MKSKTYLICDRPVKVYLVKSGHPKLGTSIGISYFDPLEIYINSDKPKHTQDATLTHELLHIIRYLAGVEDYLISLGEREEILTHLEESIFYSFLKCNTNFFGKRK